MRGKLNAHGECKYYYRPTLSSHCRNFMNGKGTTQICNQSSVPRHDDRHEYSTPPLLNLLVFCKATQVRSCYKHEAVTCFITSWKRSKHLLVLVFIIGKLHKCMRQKFSMLRGAEFQILSKLQFITVQLFILMDCTKVIMVLKEVYVS